MIHSFGFDPASVFTEAQLERIHSYFTQIPTSMSSEHQYQHQHQQQYQQSYQQPGTSPSLFLIQYTGKSREYQEQQIDLDILDSRQIKLQLNPSIPSWHELPQQSQVLPLQQSTLLPPQLPQQFPTVSVPQQPNQLPPPDIASIVSTTECLSSKWQTDNPNNHVTTMQVSQLLDTVNDYMSQSQLMQSSQLCSQVLKEEHLQMRRSLQLSHADYKPKSYHPNEALKTYPCHTYLAKLVKNKGCMARIPYLRVFNEHGKLILGSVTVGMLDLREISISQGMVDLKGPFQRMHCAAILAIRSSSLPSDQDLEELCKQIKLRHQQYTSISIHTKQIVCSSSAGPGCTITIPFSLNNELKINRTS